jgi:alkylhydroperoxidase family enzyme
MAHIQLPDGAPGIIGLLLAYPDSAGHLSGLARISEKLRALLAIASKVRRDGRQVTDEDVSAARAAGADDKAIHDTVLIAAMFWMYNRYLDGLATIKPENRDQYKEMGSRLATQGYVG